MTSPFTVSRCNLKTWQILGVMMASLCLQSSAIAAWGEPETTPQLPVQKFEPLPGKVVGVLASNNQTLLANEGRKGPADALTLGTGTGSQYWVYLPDQKKPMIGAMLFPVGKDGKQLQRFNRLNFATVEKLKPAGITQPFTLVEVEVNGGRGSPAKPSFVATSIQPVEGTKLYPLHATEVIDRLQERFAKWKLTRARALDVALTAERHELGWLKSKDTTRSEEQLFYVTWISDRKVLQVQIRHRLQEKDPLATLARPAIAYQADDGTPPKTKAERIIGVEEGVAFEVSRQGKVDRMEAIPLKEFHRSQAQPSNAHTAMNR